MIKLTKYQESELREFIDNTGNKNGVNVVPLPHSGNLSGFWIWKPHDYYDYFVSLDSSLSEKYYIALDETTTFDELKQCIEKTIFELTAYDFLMMNLEKHNLLYEVNTNELGQIVNCEVYLSDDITHEIFIEYSESNSCICDIEDEEDEDSVCYTISASDMKATKKQIRTYIKELI